MRTLQSQMEFGRKVQWFLGGIMGITLLGFYFVLYRPQTSHLDGLHMQIAAKQRQLETAQTRAAALPTVEIEVGRISARVDKFDQKIPKTHDLGTFIGDITALSQRCNLRRLNVRPGREARKHSLYSEFTLDLSFEGEFANVMSFVRLTETQIPRLTRVKDIQYRCTDSDAGVLQVNMSVQIFFTEG
jgi:Tfp pilus assembly protein PilO